MKKIFSIFFMSAMICGFVACNNSKTPVTEQGETIVTETVPEADTTASDTISVDTTVAETRGNADSEGFGRCLVSGCYCKEFEGRGQTCRNCGHAYKRHY
jgi:hypothetical protein